MNQRRFIECEKLQIEETLHGAWHEFTEASSPKTFIFQNLTKQGFTPQKDSEIRSKNRI